MLFDPADAQHLKPWLIRTLEPICDAEPGALAEYIQALLKHNASESEMRKELSMQLDEFLEKECQGFLDNLFNVLRSKSYLPYAPSSPRPSSSTSQPDAGIPIPLDGLVGSPTRRDLKRGLDVEDDAHPPAKGPRLSHDEQFSRYGNGRGWGPGPMRQAGGHGVPLANGSVYTNGRGPHYMPPDQRRGICRDYFNNGYCARGALCKFSHGEDAMVPSQLFQNMMYGNGMQSGVYDPHESRMDMRWQHQRAPIMHRGHQEEALRSRGELPVIQDLTPQVPEADMQGQPQPVVPVQDVYPPMPMNHMEVDMPPQMPGRGMGRPTGGYRGRGRPHQNGTFDTQVANFRPEQRNDKTLVVEKIPEDKLTLEEVNNWFKRFGQVTNVAIDPRGSKALVSFAEHADARAAWKSEDAVFGNRFVKVFWHRPLEGHGQAGAKALAASAPLVANFSKQEVKPTPPATATASTSAPQKPSTAATALAAKQQLLEKQIAEQKSLMDSLATASAEEKKTIMARLRKLGEEMKPSDTVDKEKQRLDKELDMLGTEPAPSTSGETTEDLKAKLEKLKAEAASLGITDESSSWSSPYRGGYRGRGRGGRGFYRGAMRGGPPRGSMKLDNRPKKLVIKGASSEHLQTIQDWYQTTGQVDSAETTDSGDIVVSFKTRNAAEQGLAKGAQIPTVGAVQVSWFTQQPDGSLQTTKPTPAPSTVEETPSVADTTEPSEMDEEVVAGAGWGGDEHAM